MSASNVIQGLIDSLSAASALGACNISSDYQVMERASGCCAIVSWMGLNATETAFGGQEDYDWTFLVEGFVKDTGNINRTMTNTILFIDVVASALSNDRTIQGTVDKINAIRASRVPGVALQSQSITYLPINIEIDVTEYDYD